VADDDYQAEYLRRCNELARGQFPAEFRDAKVDGTDVVGWCSLVLGACWPGWPEAPISPFTGTGWAGPSRSVRPLLLIGRPGTGKTWLAYAAIACIVGSGIRLNGGWAAVRAADLFAELQPRPGVDSWTSYQKYANAGLLLVDDLGATKDSPWTEAVLDRIVDYRWSRWLPTIYTTNLPVEADDGQPTLKSTQSSRLYSRLASSQIVTVKGPDRRIPE
jgi:DNA replication protein DnaC